MDRNGCMWFEGERARLVLKMACVKSTRNSPPLFKPMIGQGVKEWEKGKREV